MTESRAEKTSPLRPQDRWFVLLSFFTLTTFLLAESLYEMLARNQVFLSLRLESNLQLLAIILVFNWLPALCLFTLWGMIRKLSAGAASAFLAMACFSLWLAFFFHIHNKYTGETWQSLEHSYLIWCIPGALLALIPWKFPAAFRSSIFVLSPVVLIFPSLFLYRTWGNPQDLLPEDSRLRESRFSAEEEKRLPPIFLLVFDELTLHVLLDDAGRIDASRFPHFERLSSQSYWFPNATANGDHTYQSIPTILTGNFPGAYAPTYNLYPDNLLNLLYPAYEIYASESWTRFCLPRTFHCLQSPDLETAGQAALLRDIFYLYAAQVVPRGIHLGLPTVKRTWGLFQDARAMTEVRLKHFEKVMSALASVGDEKPIFFYFHNALPHSPYVLTPKGEIVVSPPYEFGPDLNGNRPALEEVVEKYRQQVMYADWELGRLLEQWRNLGLYDKSLLIVTADHGVSYLAGAAGRSLEEVEGVMVNADMILTVPLFIKRPFQKERAVSAEEVQLIDIVPTVAGVLELELPWEPAGRSVFAPKPETRLKIVYNQEGKRFELLDKLGLLRVGIHSEGNE